MKKVIFFIGILLCGFLGGFLFQFLYLNRNLEKLICDYKRPQLIDVEQIQAKQIEAKVLSITDKYGTKRIRLYVDSDNSANIEMMENNGDDFAIGLRVDDVDDSAYISMTDRHRSDLALGLMVDKDGSHLMMFQGEALTAGLTSEKDNASFHLNDAQEPFQTKIGLNVNKTSGAGLYTINNGECDWASFDIKGKWPFPR